MTLSVLRRTSRRVGFRRHVAARHVPHVSRVTSILAYFSSCASPSEDPIKMEKGLETTSPKKLGQHLTGSRYITFFYPARCLRDFCGYTYPIKAVASGQKPWQFCEERSDGDAAQKTGTSFHPISRFASTGIFPHPMSFSLLFARFSQGEPNSASPVSCHWQSKSLAAMSALIEFRVPLEQVSLRFLFHSIIAQRNRYCQTK